MKPFQDISVMVTGAGRGIGKRLALGFAAQGARIGLLARSQPELDLAKLEIEHAGGQALKLRADVRDLEQVQSAVDRMCSAFGGVHVLVAAAGMQGPLGPFLESKADAWAEAVETNLFGVANSLRAALPGMIERRSGKVIVLSGGGAAYGRPFFSAYAASKAGSARLVETVAEEVRDYNVQVNCMSPGGTYSHMTDEIIKAGDRISEAELDKAHQIRMTGGEPAEKQIRLALFLASPRSNHVSGKLVHVNDDWKRLEHANMTPEAFTLRRITRA